MLSELNSEKLWKLVHFCRSYGRKIKVAYYFFLRHDTRYSQENAAAADFTVYVVITDIMVIILCDGWTNGG